MFNLLTNPRESLEETLATSHVWVIAAVSKMIGEFQASLEEHPPIAMGAPDPYVPPDEAACSIYPVGSRVAGTTIGTTNSSSIARSSSSSCPGNKNSDVITRTSQRARCATNCGSSGPSE